MKASTTWDTPEWGFPKGRRNYQENDLTCGLREFEEETGYDKDNRYLLLKICYHLRKHLLVLI